MTTAQLASLPLLLLGGTPSAPPQVDVTPTVDPPVLQAACEVPLRWQIAEVDARFGLTEDDAVRAVRQAGMLWEAAVDRVLMFQESSEGIPVRFEYDERQQTTEERQAQMAVVTEQLEEIAEAEAGMEGLRSRLARLRIVHDSRMMNFEDRAAGLREMVEYWNQRGGAPPTEMERLNLMQEEVETARVAANEAAAEVNTAVQELNRATDQINQTIAEANRSREELEERYPAMRMQSGQYIDSRTGIGRLTLSREREIRIFQFEDWNHLLLVIAHELGHALGLEHTGVAGALMAEEAVAAPGEGQPEIHPADVSQLRELCPQL